MTNSDSDSSEVSRAETVECEHVALSGLETLTRGEEWEDEAFRDAGEATFGGR